MINHLRRRFVAITMISLFIVLTIIIATINIINYLDIMSQGDSILQSIVANNGVIPRGKDHPVQDKENNPANFKKLPFDSQVFSIKYDSNGEVVSVNLENTRFLTSSTVKELGSKVLAESKTKGFIENYRYLLEEQSGNKMFIFVDMDRQLATQKTFLIVSIVISIVGMGAVFILVVLLSKRAVQPIAESYEKQKQFITNSSHEIKTPLAIILANLEVIELESGESQWIDSIKNQIYRLTELTNSMTSLAKLEEATETMDKVKFSLSHAVTETVKPFGAMAVTKEKYLYVDIQPGIMLEGNEGMIRQLVGILLDNAMKYSTDSISLTLQKQRGKIVLEVENTVDSIDITKINNYFDRFYRGDSSRSSETSGYGIGLSIAQRIVEAHNGRISVSSETGETIIFSVVFAT